MSYKFPPFNSIPYPEAINFASTYDIILTGGYCSLVSKDNYSCEGCVFDASDAICAGYSKLYKQERKDLLNYVKLKHPEYLL